MGQSTDGQICYGIPFDEGFSFPWEQYCIEEWWRKVTGFKQSVQVYDENDPSGYKGGRKPAESVIDAYYEEQNEWDKAHPLPIRLVNYCSDECPMYMIALEETFKNNKRGYPQELNPSDLKVTEEQRQKLIDFCNKYLGEAIEEYNNEEYNEKKIELDPRWYLTSYWG